jgi:hypothetical protein
MDIIPINGYLMGIMYRLMGIRPRVCICVHVLLVLIMLVCDRRLYVWPVLIMLLFQYMHHRGKGMFQIFQQSQMEQGSKGRFRLRLS